MDIFGNTDNVEFVPQKQVQRGNVRYLYQLIRDFSLSVKPYESALRYQVKPDEYFDVTLISKRAYGNRGDYLAVMAGAGLDSLTDRVPDQLLVLPTIMQLNNFKRVAGFG